MSLTTPFSRRDALSGLACGIGGVGLSTLLADDLLADTTNGQPHHEPRAKSLIFLNMQGGPSQFETFTYKPELNRSGGKEVGRAAGEIAAQFGASG